ncbi:MAG: hydrophobe/amphiphile efflux-3 (HAE3) family transporter [Methanomicrobiales archaeon]|nr:hydrophobe/amphiphile efflux-3 (HAE3) family transporter [Methanomicrobiales archaeon]
MRSPYDGLARLVNAHPVSTGLVILVMLLIALYGASSLTMETGMSTYVDENTERGMLLKNYVSSFQSDSILVLIESDDVLSPISIGLLERLEDEFRSEPHVTKVTGVVDLLISANMGVVPGSKAEIDSAMGRIPAEVSSRLVPSPSMTIVSVELEPGLSRDAQFSLLDSMNARLRVMDAPPGTTVTVTGNPAFSQQMMKEMGTSMSTLLLMAMVLMILAVGILFSHVRYRLLSVLIVAAGLILTFGIMGLAGMKISMVVIGAFPVLIGIGIDYAIQFHSRFDEEARASPIGDAVVTTITKTGPQVLYAMLATSMGFLALWISPIPMVRDFGIVCIIGLFCCYLAALVIVPTMFILLKYRPRANADQTLPDRGDKSMQAMESYNLFVGKVARRVASNPIPIILVIGLVAFIGIQMDSTIPISTDEKTFVPPEMPAKIQLEKVSRAMGPSSSISMYVRGDGLLTPDGIAWIDGFQRYEQEHNSRITGSSSIVNYIALYNGGELPKDERTIRDVLESIPEATKKRYISGYSDAVIEFSMKEMESDVAMATLEQIQRDLEWYRPPVGITARVTGMTEMFTNLIREISSSKSRMTLLAFGLIFMFLLLVYRHIGRSITPVIPIVLIVGWNGLVMYILGIDYTPLTATLGSLTIGVASEYTILIAERAYEERTKGLSMLDAIHKSVGQIGTAITVSGLTTVFGFSALIFSAFNLIKSFGMVTVITVGLTLLGAIVVTPAVIALIDWMEERRRSDAGIPSPV